MTDPAIFFDEIVDAHVAIENWFAGKTHGQTLESLMSRFSSDFSMVVPAGDILDRAAVHALFLRLGGARPGLEIVISDMRAIHVDATGATIGYHEHQTLPSGRNSRRSTAVFAIDAEGKPLWRHLHETKCAD